MKKVFDFVFCQGEIDRTIVWYSVMCGKSQRDVSARHFVARIAEKQSDYLFALHSQQMAEFKERVAESLFSLPTECHISPLSLLRQRTIDICSLARFLRSYPAQLLNSEALSEHKKLFTLHSSKGEKIFQSANE